MYEIHHLTKCYGQNIFTIKTTTATPTFCCKETQAKIFPYSLKQEALNFMHSS